MAGEETVSNCNNVKTCFFPSAVRPPQLSMFVTFVHGSSASHQLSSAQIKSGLAVNKKSWPVFSVQKLNCQTLPVVQAAVSHHWNWWASKRVDRKDKNVLMRSSLPLVVVDVPLLQLEEPGAAWNTLNDHYRLWAKRQARVAAFPPTYTLGAQPRALALFREWEVRSTRDGGGGPDGLM